MIESASKCRFLVITVLLVLYVALPAGAWPDCPDCTQWNGDQCVPYGNCEGGCPNCHECVNCWCTCTSECCESSDCPECYGCVACNCENQCKPDNCESCVDGSCKVCGGDPDQICCDGVCKPKCENTESTSTCDTSYNEECLGCTVFPYTCSDFTMWEYTGVEVHYCYGGCPGDCVQLDAVHCYSKYHCMKGGALSMHACGIAPDPNLILCGPGIEGGGGGQGVACVSLPLECAFWWCSPCVKDPDTGEAFYAYPRTCR